MGGRGAVNWSNTTYMTYNENSLIPPHGGYRKLKSYQTAEIVCDLNVTFVRLYIEKNSRTKDQMEQAGRSGKQNIAEGSQASGTSKKTEIKLIGVARASFEELLQDYSDYLRQHNLSIWEKDDPRSQAVRALAYIPNRSYKTYETYLEKPENASNCLICLIHQTNYLLDRQLNRLQQDFLKNGGFTERLYKARIINRFNKK